MEKQAAKQILRRVNELHFDIEVMRQKEEDMRQMITTLKQAEFPVGKVHADFLENCGRYVFLDDLG